MNDFVITGFESYFTAHDPKGRKVRFNNRRSACFIITLKGSIRFSYDGGELISQKGAPIFLPKGLSYTNECLETAESYVFNFYTLAEHPPMALSSISQASADECYSAIRDNADISDNKGRLTVFEALYSMAKQLMRGNGEEKRLHPTVAKAIEHIMRNYSDFELSVKDIAKYCCVSEVYLRKLFQKELNVSPFRQITKIRMSKAKLLIDEKRPLKEIAVSVGYSDVFQFSRAYKRYFGTSPSKSGSQTAHP